MAHLPENEFYGGERRQINIDARIAVLEERSKNYDKELITIHDHLNKHIETEERILSEINSSIKKISETIEEKIDAAINPVKAEIQPLTEMWTKTKGVFWVISGVVGTLVLIFRDTIAHMFH